MKISLRRSHALTVGDFFWILNLEGHLNCITGLGVTAILVNGLILPICGASAVEGLLSTGPTLSSFLTDPV